MIDLRDKRIVVTGGNGFLGRHLVRRLRESRGCAKAAVVDLPEYDLRDIGHVRRMFDHLAPEIVIHLAALVGGIGANRESPGRFFYDNAAMGLHLIHKAHLRSIEKIVVMGSVCAYPKLTPVPFREEDLWNGYPEETNAPYGLAKKMLLVQLQAYRRQYGLNGIFLLPVNLYGPGDNFDPASSHVIPSLIRKCLEAKAAGAKALSVWGTGRASREFLYVEDAAEAVILAAERYDKPDPVNLGSGTEISIRDLVRLIAGATGFEGGIAWETDKPDGQPRRALDTSKAEREFGFKASTPFEIGLKKTVEWYLENMKKGHNA